MIKIALILAIIFMNASCASATFMRDSAGEVWRIETRGNITAEYEKDATKIKADSKWSDLLQGIFQMNRVQTV